MKILEISEQKERYRKLKKNFKQGKNKFSVILDRDGTINF